MNEAGMDQTKPEKCPQCGASLPTGALAGLCPACLLQQGAAADTATRPNAKPFVPPTVEEVARLFPQLEILGFLGKGGMGAVYKARQPALDRLVALKILPAQAVAPDPGFAERFTREARALARLSHPNIVAVYEFGQVDQSSAGVPPAVGASGSGTGGSAGEQPARAGGTPALPYFIMQFVDGVNLRQLQKTGRLSPREALQIVPQICDALQYAHDEGVVHRDIKPENVLVDRKGRVKIADFGLAKILGQDTEALRLTGEGQVMGTPHYMAPEQVEHPLTVDHRADIFSLGVVFYEMLTGELPLGKFQPPSRRVQVDVRLDEVVLHALEKEPERRYQHVSEVKTDVQKIASGTLPTGQAFPEPVKTRRVKKINCVPALSLYCLTNTLLVAANWREFTGHTDYFLAPYAILSWIVGGVFWAMLHYSCWKALPEKFRATTPGRALGFLFIPLFNYYWFFVSFPKLATGFNALKRERPELAIRNLRGVGIAYAITTVLVFTLALNHDGWACLIFVADLVLTFVFYLGIVANANGVIEASQAARAPTVATLQRTETSEPPRSRGRAWKIAAAVIVAVVALNGVIAVLALRPALFRPSPSSGTSTTPHPEKSVAPKVQAVATTPKDTASEDRGNAVSGPNTRQPATVPPQQGSPEPAVSSATNTESQAPTQEIARLKLEFAERELDEVARKVQVGMATPAELEKAKLARDIAAAELRRDAVEVARLRLQITEVDLRVIQKMLEVGRATPLDYDKAQLARKVAAAEYLRQQLFHP
ncbi:MAG: protein kinase domain-containing protein [Limisphaerales bacterium]